MWQVKLHPLVLEEDFKKISPVEQKHLLKSIQKKLSLDPEHYGKPLTGDFQGYWRLRVEDYRVIYRVVRNKIVVFVIKVGIRTDDQVYNELYSRLNKLK